MSAEALKWILSSSNPRKAKRTTLSCLIKKDFVREMFPKRILQMSVLTKLITFDIIVALLPDTCFGIKTFPFQDFDCGLHTHNGPTPLETPVFLRKHLTHYSATRFCLRPGVLSEHGLISVEITKSSMKYQAGIDFLRKPSLRKSLFLANFSLFF